MQEPVPHSGEGAAIAPFHGFQGPLLRLHNAPHPSPQGKIVAMRSGLRCTVQGTPSSTPVFKPRDSVLCNRSACCCSKRHYMWLPCHNPIGLCQQERETKRPICVISLSSPSPVLQSHCSPGPSVVIHTAWLNDNETFFIFDSNAMERDPVCKRVGLLLPSFLTLFAFREIARYNPCIASTIRQPAVLLFVCVNVRASCVPEQPMSKFDLTRSTEWKQNTRA